MQQSQTSILQTHPIALILPLVGWLIFSMTRSVFGSISGQCGSHNYLSVFTFYMKEEIMKASSFHETMTPSYISIRITLYPSERG